jgi:hypothetical protein
LNIELLNQYWYLFNGQKVITIATNYEEDNIDELLNLLPKDCIIWITTNNSETWEATHFIEMMKIVDHGYTFYAHCKGISRTQMIGLDIWIKNLYKQNLGTKPDLGKAIFSGICGKMLPCPPYVQVPWHYSGSFYWMKTAVVKKRMEKMNILPSRYLTESFPAMVAKEEECLFPFYKTKQNENFYKWQTWQSILQSKNIPITSI